MRKIYFLFITILSLTCISCGLTKPTSENPIVNNPVVNDSIVNYKDFAGFDIPMDSINLIIDGNTLSFSTPVYLQNNRYFICLNEVIDLLKGTLDVTSNSLSITTPQKSFTINIEKNSVVLNNKTIQLKKALLVKNNIYYINLSDLTNILDIYARWDPSSKTISCKTQDNSTDAINPYQSKIDKLGFLRIEDVALSTESYDREYLEKLRIISNYLYKRNIPYHIAWIPRYINPTAKIDVDPRARKDFTVAELIFTLDYISNHNGLIGLHGYTHQNGNEISGVGFEF